MKSGAKTIFCVATVFFLAAAARTQEQLKQLPPVGYATNFSSVTYFDPPHEQSVKVRLSGAEASPLPGAKFELKEMKVEKFNSDGRLEAQVRAPECTYAIFDKLASSPGHLELASGDGKFHVEGDGFLWREKTSSLIISNHVRTVINIGITNLPTL